MSISLGLGNISHDASREKKKWLGKAKAKFLERGIYLYK